MFKIKNKSIFLGSLAILLAAFLWSIDGLFLRPSFYSFSPYLLVFWEHFLGLIFLSPFIILNWSKIKKISLKGWLAIFWISIFGGVIGTIFITKAFFLAINGKVTFSTVILLQKLQPIFALLLARIILKERLPKQFYFWSFLAILASYFLAFYNGTFDIKSVNYFHSAAIFAIIAAFSFGSSTVFGKRIVNHLDFKLVAALRFLFTTILMALIILILNIGFYPNFSLHYWLLLFVIVLGSGAGAMFIYYYGLHRISASKATILELFWPFSALIMDYLFYHHTLSPIQILAAIILLISFFKITLYKRKTVSFIAKVVPGQGLGRTLGYRTANLDNTELDIAHGIYKVRVKIGGKEYKGVMHFGFKEIVNGPVSLEVAIKDFNQNIYNKNIRVIVLEKIREVKKFSSFLSLQQAIERDINSV